MIVDHTFTETIEMGHDSSPSHLLLAFDGDRICIAYV